MRCRKSFGCSNQLYLHQRLLTAAGEGPYSGVRPCLDRCPSGPCAQPPVRLAACPPGRPAARPHARPPARRACNVADPTVPLSTPATERGERLDRSTWPLMILLRLLLCCPGLLRTTYGRNSRVTVRRDPRVTVRRDYNTPRLNGPHRTFPPDICPSLKIVCAILWT